MCLPVVTMCHFFAKQQLKNKMKFCVKIIVSQKIIDVKDYIMILSIVHLQYTN
jgi:hypothetical protein